MRGSASKKIPIGKATPSSSAEVTSDVCRDLFPHADTLNHAAAARRQIEIKTLEVYAPTADIPSAKPSRPFRDWTRVLGALGTLLVHAIALNSVGWRSSSHKAPPRIESTVSPTDELVLLNIDSTQKGDADLHRWIASLAPLLTDARIEVVSPEPLEIADALDAGDASIQTPEPGDPALRALMAGRYRGQISARIERVWVRPRTPVDDSRDGKATADSSQSDDTFSCQVQVRQDAAGNVQEVLLLRCNGTEAWRHSLVVAINQSSPLPAPPIPTVFSRELTMTFEAHAYEPGAPPDEYERQAGDGAVVSSTRPARSAAQPFATANGQEIIENLQPLRMDLSQ